MHMTHVNNQMQDIMTWKTILLLQKDKVEK